MTCSTINVCSIIVEVASLQSKLMFLQFHVLVSFLIKFFAGTKTLFIEQLDNDKTFVSHIVGPQSKNCKNFNCLKLFAEDSSSIGKTVTRGESICPSVL